MKILGPNKCMIILKISNTLQADLLKDYTVYIPLEVNEVLIWPYFQQKLIVVKS